MTTFNYARVQATAERMLTKFGQSVTITHKVVGNYDPQTGTAPVTETVQTAMGDIDNYSVANRAIAGSLIQQNDKKLMLSASGINKPETNDMVVANGITYTILNVVEDNHANIPLLYTCQLREP